MEGTVSLLPLGRGAVKKEAEEKLSLLSSEKLSGILLQFSEKEAYVEPVIDRMGEFSSHRKGNASAVRGQLAKHGKGDKILRRVTAEAEPLKR